MPSKNKLIVFDIDGTLSDTVHIHQRSFKAALKEIGIKSYNEQFGSFKHHTDFHIARVIYETATLQPFDETIARRFEQHLHDSIRKEQIIAIRGAQTFIEMLEEETDFGICFATGSLQLPAVYKLETIGVEFKPWQLVASNGIEERERIVETAIENAKRQYNAQKFERILSFGDGIWDLHTANHLSLEFVGIGHNNRELLLREGAQKHYADYTGLLWNEL